MPSWPGNSARLVAGHKFPDTRNIGQRRRQLRDLAVTTATRSEAGWFGIEARLADRGGDALALSPADFGELIADETEKWGKVVRAANIKAQ